MSGSSSDMCISQEERESESENLPPQTPAKWSSKRTLESEVSPPNRYTPTSRQRDTFDFFAHRRAVKKMKMDDGVPNQGVWKVNSVKEGIYADGKLIFRVSWATGRVKIDKNGSPFVRFIAMDQTGKIQCGAFKENAKRIFDQLKVGKTYEHTGFRVERESQDTKINPFGYPFKIILQDYSKLESIDDDESTGIPKIEFEFKTIGELKELPRGTRADFLGIMVVDYGKEEKILYNKTTVIRDILFVDSAFETHRFVFYDEMAEDFIFKEYEPVILGNIMIHEYQEMGGNTTKNFRVYGTSLVINPATGQEAEELKNKFMQELKETE